ncbi:hypothetical protein ACVOMS_06680 [Bradyrhizobium guangxiense]
MSNTSYPIDLDSIRGAFPPGIEAPPLLVDFAAWLSGRPWGSVGCFSLQGQFSDSAPIVDGSPLRDRFSLFMRLPDGSAVGGWYGAGLDRDNPPIVGLGSEGDYELLAPSLDGLLAKLTSQQFDKAWSDLKPREDVESQTVELAQWLARQPAGDKAACDDSACDLPDFRGFVEKWSRDREDYWANHRLMAETRLAASRRICRKARSPGTRRASRSRSSASSIRRACCRADRSHSRRLARSNPCCAICAMRCARRSPSLGCGT